MKKILLFGIIILSGFCAGFAEVNMPGAPSYEIPRYSDNNVVSQPIVQEQSDPVKSTAKALATAQLNGGDIQELYKKLMDKGATNISLETHVNGCPRRKGIPPVSLGGKTYTGQKCSFVKYTYNGNSTGVGACK